MSGAGHYSLARLRSSLLHFVVGKAGSAVLNFAAFMLVVRLLDVADYGRYVALLATVELALAIGNFGLDWVAARYIPDYRVRANGKVFVRFLMCLGGLQTGIYLVFALALALGRAPLATLLGLPVGSSTVLGLYAIYLFCEGVSRLLRDQMLGHLLLQGRAQAALVARNLAWVLGLLYLGHAGASLVAVAVVELFAAAVGAVLAGLGLWHVLAAAWRVSQPMAADWQAPSLTDMRHLAASSYLSYLFALAYGPQIITLLLSRLAGPEATAVFGFARNLSDQVRRYLPAELLLGLVRPALVARYVASGDFAALNRQVGLLFCVSLFALAPLLVLALAWGAPLAGLLSGGKYPQGGVMLALFLLTLLPFSHRRCAELVANTVGRPQACVRASARLLLMPPLVAAVLWAALPLWAVVAVLSLAEVAFSFFVVGELRRVGFAYRFPWRAVVRSLLAVALVAGLLVCLPLPPSFMGLALALGLACVLTGLALLGLQPLDASERAAIRALLLRRGAGLQQGESS